MHKIDIKLAEKWSQKGEHGHKGPRHIDLRCPHDGCGKPTFSIPIDWQFVGNAACAEISCVGCDNRINFYMVRPPSGKKTIEELKTEIYQHI